MSTFNDALRHLIDLGYNRDTACDIAGMDVSTDEQTAHYDYILSCDETDIIEWIGIAPNGGAA